MVAMRTIVVHTPKGGCMNSGKNAHHLCTASFNAVDALLFFITLFLLLPFGGRAQDAWTGLGSPPGAMIHDVARIGGTIVAETRIGDTGMNMRYWRSDDAGQSWTAFARQEGGDLFVAHGYVWLLASPSGLLFRADPDSGWLEVPTNL